jgi:hypothetical protein
MSCKIIDVVLPSEEMPGMEVQLHLPDMHHSLPQTTSECADHERFERKACHEVCFALCTTH